MDGYGKRVLIIDDGSGCRALLEAQLAQEGYAVYTAYLWSSRITGPGAETTLRRSHRR